MTPARTAPESYEPTIATTRRIERHRLLSDAGLTRCAAAAAGNGAGAFDRGPHQGLRNMKSLVTDYFTIAPGTATERFWELLFPLPFRRDLMRQSSASDLDPHMVAGLVRQESEFNPSNFIDTDNNATGNATGISPKKAYWLTQIVPSSRRQLARKAGIRGFSTSLLYQPSTNLLGTTYLRSLLDQWGGKWEQMLASYNAGKSRVLEWITWGNFQEPAEFVETTKDVGSTRYSRLYTFTRNRGLAFSAVSIS